MSGIMGLLAVVLAFVFALCYVTMLMIRAGVVLVLVLIEWIRGVLRGN